MTFHGHFLLDCMVESFSSLIDVLMDRLVLLGLLHSLELLISQLIMVLLFEIMLSLRGLGSGNG